MSDGLVHPRHSSQLFGHAAAEVTLLEALRSGRFAHAWLISGPEGVGKATLAYRLARHLLAQAPMDAETLALDPAHPTFRRIAAQAHADLVTVERGVEPKTGRRRSEIVIADCRAVGTFLRQTPAEGGWRVVIIDSADEMNLNAANAILKVLEEPPRRSALLLVSHAPGRLLPTIRSRCRELRLSRLSAAAVAAALGQLHPGLDAAERERIAALAAGRPGFALALAEAGGAALAAALDDLIAGLGRADAATVDAFVDRFAGETAFACAFELLNRRIVEAVRAHVNEGVRGDADGLIAWVEALAQTERLRRTAAELNLDRRQLLYATVHQLTTAARVTPLLSATG